MALTDLQNLLSIGAVKQAHPDRAGVEQYLKNAENFYADCTAAKSPVGRFTMAYEGIHAVAMAVLLHFEARPGDGEGHRAQALGITAKELDLNTKKPGATRVLMEIHRARNEKIYRQPIPPVSEATTRAAQELLELMIKSARELVAGAS